MPATVSDTTEGVINLYSSSPKLKNYSTNTQARLERKRTDDALGPEEKLRGSAKPQHYPEHLATSALLPNRSHACTSVDHVPTRVLTLYFLLFLGTLDYRQVSGPASGDRYLLRRMC
jgi:hypothetical protein